jgi:hypothetical protein
MRVFSAQELKLPADLPPVSGHDFKSGPGTGSNPENTQTKLIGHYKACKKNVC